MPIPTFLIIIWSGAINEIPEGWFLCDGQNNTPNLQNRFVVGIGNKYSLSETGGSADAVVLSHTHTVAGGTDTAENHTHSISGQGSTGLTPTTTLQVGDPSSGSISTSSAGGHSHTVNLTLPNSVSAVDKNLPPYYALAYIMKGAQ
jgi:hypothetical protein